MKKERIITIDAEAAARAMLIASYSPSALVFHKNTFYATHSTVGSEVYSKSSVENCADINDMHFYDAINDCPVKFAIDGLTL
jgi:hypothetical protein